MRWAVIRVVVAAMVVLDGSVAGALAAGTMDPPAFAARVLELTNAERQKFGLQPLTLSPQLDAAAQGYSQVLATSGCFDHTCGPVPSFSDRLGQAGYGGWSAVGENI